MKILTNAADLAGAESEASRATWLPEIRENSNVRSRAFDAVTENRSRDKSVGKAVRIVGLLAFGQSLLFLALWLLMCASAGAAPAKQPEFTTDLSVSTYNPTKQRSPLSKLPAGVIEVKSQPGVPLRLQLDGILYEATNPAAIVNGQVLSLNKVVTINSDGIEAAVRAVEITRSRVVLEVAGRTVELSLRTQSATDSEPKR
jgi:hypothetical protein